VLIATPGFAAVAAVAPDFVVPAPFLFPGGGTINYAGVDIVTYGALPTDSVTSIDRNDVGATATPTNFAGQTGSLVAVAPPPQPVAASVPGLDAIGILLLAMLVAFAAWPFRRAATARRRTTSFPSWFP